MNKIKDCLEIVKDCKYILQYYHKPFAITHDKSVIRVNQELHMAFDFRYYGVYHEKELLKGKMIFTILYLINPHFSYHQALDLA